MKTAVLFLVILGLSVSSAYAVKRPIAVEDRGLDGEERIYSVRCPDDRRVAIAHQFKNNQICYVPLGGQETCINGNNLDAAAKLACLQSTPK